MTRIEFWILVSCGAVLLVALPACNSDGDARGGDADSDGDSDGDTDCGTLADGDSDISGHPVLDGSFAALLALRDHADAIRDDLDATVGDLCQAFEAECPADATVADRVAELKTEIEAEISACVAGGIEVCHVPPECSAGIAAAMAAMYACESGMGCDVDDGCLSSMVTGCEGECNGACSGGCSGYCEAEVTGWECWGLCDGICETTTAEDCLGACDGICAGECYGTQTGDSCDGVCSGTCLGICEACAPEECPGDCTGICLAEPLLSDLCEGTCHGSCNAECDGGCRGDVQIQTCCIFGECVATGSCADRPARLRARAEVACTGAEVETYYKTEIGLSGDAMALLMAGMDALAAAFGPLEQATFENLDMCDADWCGEYGFQSGLVVAQSIFDDLWQAFQDGDLDDGIEPAKYDCVEPAFEEAWVILDDLVSQQQEVLAAQLELLGLLNLD
jgi:hypothetical protein